MLFTRFGKLHRTAEMNSEGIGLGLMIVKHIVKRSEGRVSVFSEGVDKGTCFTFSMKMSLSQQETYSARSGHRPPSVQSNEKGPSNNLKHYGM